MEELVGRIEYPNQSESIGKLAAALSKAQGQLIGATKNAVNPYFESKYADLHECIEAAKKPLADNELAVIQTTAPAEKGLDIITTLVHSSGEWIRGTIRMTPKRDDDQGRGSSITYGRRYAFAAIVGLAQKDDDGNASSQQGKQEEKNQPEKSLPQYKTEKEFNEWENYIDQFTGFTLASLEKNWKEKLVPMLPKFTEKHRADLIKTYESTKLFLKEKEAA